MISISAKTVPSFRLVPLALKHAKTSKVVVNHTNRLFSSTSLTTAPDNGTPGKLTLPYKIESPLAPLGVAAAVSASTNADDTRIERKIFKEFTLTDRVALVSGANHGLGLEMAMALGEAGARAVYCLDLPEKPSDEWFATKEYLRKMGRDKEVNGEAEYARLEYISADVRDQAKLWKIGDEIGDKEGRLDVGVAAAGIPSSHTDCLDYSHSELNKVCKCIVGEKFYSPLFDSVF